MARLWHCVASLAFSRVQQGEGFGRRRRLGRGVDLQIREAPALSQFEVGTLDGSMTVTVEPGDYPAGRGGVRIGDTLVVTGGEPELLTLTTKDLVVVSC